jgi:hypothetical protein
LKVRDTDTIINRVLNLKIIQMKKVFLGSIAILAIAAVVAFNVSLNAPSNKLPAVFKANVETLVSETSTPMPNNKNINN